MLSVSGIRHIPSTLTELTDKYAECETPTVFKQDALRPHQSVVVKAYLDMEAQCYIRITQDNMNNHNNRNLKGHMVPGSDMVIQTCGIVISQEFGSGKTHVIIAIIGLRPVPAAVPPHLNAILINNTRGTSRFTHEITMMNTAPQAHLTPNLIIVGASVLYQWYDFIINRTTLRVLMIENAHGFVKFQEILDSGHINEYDIVLLKNGNVTGKFVSDASTSAHTMQSTLFVMKNITINFVWSRVIYDDFDTIGIPPDSQMPNSLFSIFVSATRKQNNHYNHLRVEYPDIITALRDYGTPMRSITADDYLFTNFNLRCTSAFVEKSINIPNLVHYRYVRKNPGDNYMKLMGIMGDEDATNIMQMLNGDAIGEAAAAMNIKSKSPADIFKKMLDTKYESFMTSLDIITECENVMILLDEHKTNGIYHPDGKRPSEAYLANLRQDLIKLQEPEPEYFAHEIAMVVNELQREYNVIHQQSESAIRRMIDNLKEGNCQVCRISMKNSNAFIVKCCGLITCDDCGIKGNRIGKHYNYRLKKQCIFGKCANCSKDIFPAVDLIYIDNTIDIDALINARGDEEQEEEELPPPEEEVPEDPTAEKSLEQRIKEIELPKVRDTIMLLHCMIPDDRAKVDEHIPRLLVGKKFIELPRDTKRKFVIFAGYNESINNITTALNDFGIEYLKLGGTAENIAQTIADFRERGTVLLVNSNYHCAGLNIEFATDEILYHKIEDENVKGQVIGRCQRYGRTCSLTVHHLLYTNE
jgi:hypothetical protein